MSTGPFSGLFQVFWKQLLPPSLLRVLRRLRPGPPLRVWVMGPQPDVLKGTLLNLSVIHIFGAGIS
jgi:hypothetical protein